MFSPRYWKWTVNVSERRWGRSFIASDYSVLRARSRTRSPHTKWIDWRGISTWRQLNVKVSSTNSTAITSSLVIQPRLLRKNFPSHIKFINQVSTQTSHNFFSSYSSCGRSLPKNSRSKLACEFPRKNFLDERYLIGIATRLLDSRKHVDYFSANHVLTHVDRVRRQER